MQFSEEQMEYFPHVNDLQYKGQKQGHYESYFLRANHPSRPLAFWIRYTIFSPIDHPEKAIGEVWAIWFDGEKNRHVATKKEIPFSECYFSDDHFEVKCGECRLDFKQLSGSLHSKNQTLSWSLNYKGDQPPALFFAVKNYQTKFPKAKVLSSLPLAEFTGEFLVNGEKILIDQWRGSQNHNWGPKHTDYYAWGQVCGFDNAPESFLEVGSAKLKIGPLWTPFLTPLVLRHKGQEYAINTIWQSLCAKVKKFTYFDWQFFTRNEEVEISGRIYAEKKQFVGLNYYNPPGGNKYCLNSKIAECQLKIIYLKEKRQEILSAKNRTAFEIITDDSKHGIIVSV